jgi:hypothetical protein
LLKDERRRDRGRFRIMDDVGRSPICKLARRRSANLPVAKLHTLVIISHSLFFNLKSQISTGISSVNIKVVASRGSAIMTI